MAWGGRSASRHSRGGRVAVNLAWSAHPGPEGLSEAPPTAYNSWAGVSPCLQSCLSLRRICCVSSASSPPLLPSSPPANPAVSVLIRHGISAVFSDYCNVPCLFTNSIFSFQILISISLKLYRLISVSELLSGFVTITIFFSFYSSFYRMRLQNSLAAAICSVL